MRKYFGIQLKPMETPMYKKPYQEWVDHMMMPLPKGYKTLDFSTFSGEDNKSTMECIRQFTT